MRNCRRQRRAKSKDLQSSPHHLIISSLAITPRQTPVNAMSLESKLQDISSEIQKIQVMMSKAVTAREKLEAQLQENELVKKVNSRIGGRILDLSLLRPTRNSQI